MSELRARRSRSDRGRSRLDPAVEKELQSLLEPRGYARPGASEVSRGLAEFCRRSGRRVPARSTVYNAVNRLPPIQYDREALPGAIKRTLHNVGGARIAGRQIVFAAFNYGDVAAISYASALPWSCLWTAAQIRGWRPKSLALLRAVMHRRGMR